MTDDMIPLDACEPGTIYRLSSRNLTVGVYDGKQGFIGIRTKFGSRYLFTEYHWEQGPPYGTVRPLEVIGKVAQEIPLTEYVSQRPPVQNKNLFAILDQMESEQVS